MNHYMKRTAIGIAVVATLGGCASPVNKEGVAERARALTSEMSQRIAEEAKRRTADEELVVRVATPYLSARTVALSKDAKAPAAFSQAFGFVRPPTTAGFTIPQVADLISKKYGIRVRVRPDVFLPASSLVPGGGSAGAATTSPTATAAPTPVAPPSPLAIPPGLVNQAQPQQPAGYDSTIDFDFTGSLTEYLARLSSKTGINWEWSDADQELVLFRLVRKTFYFDASPSTVMLSSSVSKGSSASTGASSGSGGGSSNSGSISGNSNATMTLSSDAWSSVVAILNKMKTKSGTVEPNPATRTITMIDTNDVVADAERFMAQQNEILSRQVLLSVRLVRVSINRTNDLDFNLELALQRAVAGASPWNIAVNGAGSVASGVASRVTYSVVDPTRSTSGSNLIIQALRELGEVTDEFSQDIPVKNNRPVPVSEFSTTGFLARTQAAAASTSGSGGTTGLEPGNITSGITMVLTPSIQSGESLSLLLSLDKTPEPTFDVISTGSGSTFQQIQLPRQRGSFKVDTEIAMRNNQSLVLVGTVKDGMSNTNRQGLLSVGNSAQATREVQLLIVTPKIISGS